MANGSAAYNYRQAAEAYAIPERTSRPRVRVVPGTRRAPSVSPQTRLLVKLVAIAVVAVAVVCCVRVGLVAATASAQESAQDLQSQVQEMKLADASVTASNSSLSNPTTVKKYAEDNLDMVQPESTETVTLAPDVVQHDAQGDLSLSKSVAVAVSQG